MLKYGHIYTYSVADYRRIKGELQRLSWTDVTTGWFAAAGSCHTLFTRSSFHWGQLSEPLLLPVIGWIGTVFVVQRQPLRRF